MANYWAILIGINQYQFFQPLGYAQADAEGLRNCLLAQAGFLPENCLLMTDTSPPWEKYSTYPSQENLLQLLGSLIPRLQKEDHLWIFFSGYGVYHDRQDYLMPVQGDPKNIVATGIEVRSLFLDLHNAAIGSVVVLLDMNRAAGTEADVPLGQETLELGFELEIPVILACTPHQYSRESAELGHGFFTSVLIEALQVGYANTLGELEGYLSDRTPQLCQHYWRPIQNPVAAIRPPENREQIILAKLSINHYELEGGEWGIGEVGNGRWGEVPEIPLITPPLPYSPTPPLPYSPTAASETLPKILWWAVGVMLLLSLMLFFFSRNREATNKRAAVAAVTVVD